MENITFDQYYMTYEDDILNQNMPCVILLNNNKGLAKDLYGDLSEISKNTDMEFASIDVTGMDINDDINSDMLSIFEYQEDLTTLPAVIGIKEGEIQFLYQDDDFTNNYNNIIEEIRDFTV